MIATAVRAVRLALLHTRRAQLLILRGQVAADPSPAALVRCDAQLALVACDIERLRLQAAGRA